MLAGHQPFKRDMVHLVREGKFWMMKLATQGKGNSGKIQVTVRRGGNSPVSFTFFHAHFHRLVLNCQTSFLDYYNSLFMGCPASTLPMLHVLSTGAAKVILWKCTRDCHSSVQNPLWLLFSPLKLKPLKVALFFFN